MLNKLEIKSAKYYVDLDGETNIGITMTLKDEKVFMFLCRKIIHTTMKSCDK